MDDPRPSREPSGPPEAERMAGGTRPTPRESALEERESPHAGEPPELAWGKVTVTPEERRFLEGPGTRLSELRRAWGIFLEFLRGFRALHFVGPSVTVFGSARVERDSPYYELGREVGRRLSDSGFTVLTGGGPGLMEAANRGAREAGGPSIGVNIELPHEQVPNPFLDRWITFEHFYVRKVMLVKYSVAFVVLPGGFGTMDEIFETATLVQTGKIHNFPIVLMGREYWAPLMAFLEERSLRAGMIDPPDLELLRVTDSPEEAVQVINDSAARLLRRTWLRSRRSRLLGE